MSDRSQSARDRESMRRFLRLVREGQRAGPDDDRFWDAITRGAEDIDVSAKAQEEVRKRARLALALARGELTLGRYLSSLRQEAKLSRAAASKGAHLAADVVAEIESGSARILSIQPGRLACLAVRLGAIKAALLELTANAIGGSSPQLGLSRLTRIGRGATRLDSERAVRRTQARRSDSQPDTYLSELSIAFDDELERTQQA